MSTTLGATRIALLLGAAIGLSACNTTAPSPEALTPAPSASAQQPVTATGTIPDYCPQVTLREGTAVLRKGERDAIQYVASITGTTRSCRVRDSQLYMEVAVRGRLVPGPAAATGTVSLPIRVAIVDAGAVAYSELGQQSVNIDPNGGPIDFAYIDRAVRLPVPQGRTLTVYAGFDEGAPAAGQRTASARRAN